MFLFSDYPVIDPSRRETFDFIDRYRSENNLFSGVAHKISYTGNRGNFSFKTVLSGTIDYFISGHRKRLERGSVLIINHDTPYDCFANSSIPVQDLCLQITPQTLTEALAVARCDDTTLLDDCNSNSQTDILLFDTLHKAPYSFAEELRLMSQANLSNECRDEMVIELMQRFCRLYFREIKVGLKKLPHLSAVVRSEVARRLQLGRDFIHEAYYQKIELAEIARMACLSPSYFLPRFREFYGISPHQYLTQLRLHKAEELLRWTDNSVEEIAGAVGFESTSSFIRLFRTRLRTTPVQYRKEMMQKEGFLCFTKKKAVN